MSLSAAAFHCKLYGVPLSQPFRSVAWMLLLQQQSFQVVLTVPGMKNKMGSRHESFVEKTKGRTGQVPMLEIIDNSDTDSSDDDTATLCISESPAIMAHVCERLLLKESTNKTSSASHRYDSLYAPPATRRKASMDSYMSWHHGATRQSLSALARPMLRPDLKLSNHDGDDENHDKLEQEARNVLEQLNHGWLSQDDNNNNNNNKVQYIAGDDEHPSIADLLCYEEIAQCSMTGLLPFLEDDYPNVFQWMKAMQQVPFHKEIHASLVELGDLSSNSREDTVIPMSKRLGNATKVGMQAIKDAQATYSSKL